MSHVSREGCRADYEEVLKVTSRRFYYEESDRFEWEMFIGRHGTPCLRKAVEYGTFVCPECSTLERPVPCYVDEFGDKPCPECGLLNTVRFPVISPPLKDVGSVKDRQKAVGQKWFKHYGGFVFGDESDDGEEAAA